MLKTIGVISGAAMAAPMIPGISGKAFAGTAANILSGKRSLGIGLLLPGSTSPSSHAARLRRGLELALAINGARAGGRRIELIAAEVHPSVAATLRAARELASDDRTDVVVGMTSPRVTRMIADVFEEERTLFIETGAGETMTLPAERRPHIFHNSLGLWRSTMALGAWAARNLGRNGGVMASFYDSGHDTLMAFRHGFEEAGGRIVIEQITGTPKRNAVELTLANAAVSTSGDLEQFVEIKGVRYSHVLDPRTGLGLTGRRSVTVIAPKGIDADSMTKAVSVLPPEQALKLIEATPGAACYVVILGKDGKPVATASKRFPEFEKPVAK